MDGYPIGLVEKDLLLKLIKRFSKLYSRKYWDKFLLNDFGLKKFNVKRSKERIRRFCICTRMSNKRYN
jgi:hypothetical protein